MMNSILKVILKLVLQMVVWVFVLSISWNGRTLFDRAHDVLVDNSVVEEIDAKLGEVWDSMKYLKQKPKPPFEEPVSG